MPDDLKVEKLLEESLTMQGGLGALAYVVLKGLQAGGAETKVISSVRLLLQKHFEQLSDHNCNALCDVAYARLKKEAEKGSWY